MFKHPLTDKGLDAFLSDWAKTGQSILNQRTDDAAE
jgi:transaldolase